MVWQKNDCHIVLIIKKIQIQKNDLKIELHSKNDYIEVFYVLELIGAFTCYVESNLCTTGEVFRELIILKGILNELINVENWLT